MSMTATEVAVKLKAWMRLQQTGGCKLLTLGAMCGCPMCLVDKLVALAVKR